MASLVPTGTALMVHPKLGRPEGGDSPARTDPVPASPVSSSFCLPNLPQLSPSSHSGERLDKCSAPEAPEGCVSSGTMVSWVYEVFQCPVTLQTLHIQMQEVPRMKFYP